MTDTVSRVIEIVPVFYYISCWMNNNENLQKYVV